MLRKTSQHGLPPELLLDLLLVLFEGPLGSGDLAEAVAELRRRPVPPATFYRQLQKAVDSGWVEVDSGSESPSGPGRPERRYRITDLGEHVLRTGMESRQRRVRRASALGLLAQGAS